MCVCVFKICETETNFEYHIVGNHQIKGAKYGKIDQKSRYKSHSCCLTFDLIFLRRVPRIEHTRFE